jgi:predicted alpha/beta-fold hydrolase
MIKFPSKPAPVIKHFLDQNKQLVYKYLLVKINHAVKNNLDTVEVFQHNSKVESIKKKDFEKTLDHAIKEFCKVEDYENAALCKKVISKITINNLIDSTTSDTSCNISKQESV